MRISIIEMIERAIGPFLFITAITASALFINTTERSLRIAKLNNLGEPVLRQDVDPEVYSGTVDAADIISEIMLHPEHPVVIRSGAKQVSFRFLPDGSIMQVSEHLNESVGSQDDSSLVVNSLNELDTSWIIGKYSYNTTFTTDGVLSAVIYSQGL